MCFCNEMSYLCKNFERMKFPAILFLLCLWTFQTVRAEITKPEEDTDSVSLLDRYLLQLEELAYLRDSLNAYGNRDAVPNAYYFQLMCHPTLYNGPLRQMMSRADSITPDRQLQRLFSSGKMLSGLYTKTPWLVKQTEAELKGQTAIRNDVNEKLHTSDKLADKVTASLIKPDYNAPVEIVTRRPNWWKVTGNTQLNFSQNHYSENWYQGGESNYAGNFTLTIWANYNDQRNISWQNTLESQIGFQTTDTDKERSVRVTSNLLRFTTNFGYKAWRNWYYSLQVVLKSQPAPTYEANSTKVTSKFLSPLEVTIAPGMKYNIAWGKKKRFTGTFNAAPLALNIFHVSDDDLVKRYGLEEGTNNRLSFGPNATLDTRWTICPQITWTSRIFYITNLDFHKIEWTNTIDFAITKIIKAQLNLYPRFDDSSDRYKNDRGRYWMFKEWMTIGIQYSF